MIFQQFQRKIGKIWNFSLNLEMYRIFEEYAPEMESSDAVEVFISFLHVDPLPSLVGIRFTHLLTLDLSQNRIESIELLPSLQAPLLDYLKLNGNQIVSFAALRKCCFTLLKRLRIQNNMDLSFRLCEDDFPILKQLSFSSKSEINDIFRLNARQLTYICSPSLVSNSRAGQMLARKYSQIQIESCFDNHSTLDQFDLQFEAQTGPIDLFD